MSYRVRLLCVALMWFIWDLAAVAQIRAVSDRAVIQAVLLAMAIPFIGHLSSSWFIDEPCRLKRLGLTAAGAIGSALGTAAVLLGGG